jgi:hypothetical protein
VNNVLKEGRLVRVFGQRNEKIDLELPVILIEVENELLYLSPDVGSTVIELDYFSSAFPEHA